MPRENFSLYMGISCFSTDSTVLLSFLNEMGFFLLLQDGGPYHIETCPSISRASQWTGLYMIGTSVMKELELQIKTRNY